MKPPHVGLFTANMEKCLPVQVRGYLESDNMKKWYKDYAKNYRDALAHRIPLYVPPSIHMPIHEERYRELDEKIKGEVKNRNFDRAQMLSEEQDALGSICPVFLHSSQTKTRVRP